MSSSTRPLNGSPRRSLRLTMALGFACLLASFGRNASTLGAAELGRDRPLDYLNARGEVAVAQTPAQWESRRRSILESMQAMMGTLPSPAHRCPIDLVQEDESDQGRFLRRSITYQILPGVRVPAYLLVPKSALAGGAHKAPAVLALHQTHPAGRKVVVGLGNSPDDEYAVELANRGYVCLAPPYPMLSDYWPDVKKLGFESGTLLAVWINSRGLDVLSSLAYVNTNRYGSIGHSLGGHNGIYTAAFDSRIGVVVSSCGLDSYRDYYGGDPAVWGPEKGWCQTRYIPRLAAYQGRLQEIPFDFAEILAAIAPRRIFLNAPLRDSNFRWQSVDRLTRAANEVFAIFPGATPIQVVHPDSPHRFPPEIREEAYRCLDQVLLRSP